MAIPIPSSDTMPRTKTKIVATIGPSCSSKEVLRQLIDAGMSVARLNFSHGTHADHEEVINSMRALDSELKSYSAILADLSGPKIRVGELETEEITLTEGNKLILTADKMIGTSQKVSISYPSLAEDV
ncbi:MAG: pyruvate kinase, partial [Flavobacteriales bacterium]|nr:pyruvate kinase [Flavobacteriales bacterium]